MQNTKQTSTKPRVLSFFSGAMGLDLGLEKAGLSILLACEKDRACQQTITANRPGIKLIDDIAAHDAAAIRAAAGLGPNDDIDVMAGGPPCQSFSTAGRRRGLSDPRGNALLIYVDRILALRPRYAVIENVRGLLSAPAEPGGEPGGALAQIVRQLRDAGYGVSMNLYNAANFGVPQSRERLVILCVRDAAPMPDLMPTHAQHGAFGLPPWRTLRDAIGDMDHQHHDHQKFPPSRLPFYQMLGPGQHWRHLPEDLQRRAMGRSLDAGGGKTGFYRRLSWDAPSCTLVTSPAMFATSIGHPVADRPLSIQEYARIQQFPDDWIWCGSLSDRYRQIGNAVPVGLGEAIGRAILRHMAGSPEAPPDGFVFSRYKKSMPSM